jgi:hypothetical protein
MNGFQTDATGPWIEKDPAAVLDYQLDWDVANDSWLAGDTIAGVVWTVDTGLIRDSQSNSTTAAKVWLSGGTAGTTYQVACRITTAAGRSDERTFRVAVKQR